MQNSLGSSWMSNFESFDRLPFAAASIGQVHSAVLAASASPTGKPAPVAVKVQFPNIVNSIDSDIGYVKLLLTAGRLLPPGLFLERTIQVMKEELAEECDYEREGTFLRRFREGLGPDHRFKVPWVWDGSTKAVLVMERVNGVSVGGSVINQLSQRDRDDVGMLVLCNMRFSDSGSLADRRTDRRPLPARAVRPPANADGPQLDELPLERTYAQGRARRLRCDARVL